MRGRAMGTNDERLDASHRDKVLKAGRELPKSADLPAVAADYRIEAALELIRTNLGGVSASAIASHLGLSRSRFEHLFKAETGTTFRAYLRQTRLSTALQFLVNSRLRVKEISAQCGYASTSNLSREFKREFGVTPSEYRHSTSRQQIAH